MKPYSIDFREKIVRAAQEEGSSIRETAQRFMVGKNLLQKLLNEQRTEGHVIPGKQGGSMVSPVMHYKDQLIAIHEKNKDATLAEYCELLADETGKCFSVNAMCRALQKLELIREKKRCAPAKRKVSESNSLGKNTGQQSQE
jgi:transposase